MQIYEYDKFVERSDQYRDRPRQERLDIASYGLAAEIGSVVAAVKKRLLSSQGAKAWNRVDAELIEELGDVMWYCFALARAYNERPINIFAHDVTSLRRGLKDSKCAPAIIARLGEERVQEFLAAAASFPRRSQKVEFSDYQKIAYLTARSEDRVLAEVCIAVLWQLSAQILRRKLPQFERDINTELFDKPVNDALGEIAWHVSALASLFGLSLSDIASENMKKVSDRWFRDNPTPLHDEGYPETEKLPRQFRVSFFSIKSDRARMYVDGKRVGDDLTDNAYAEDGYRFHDVMHLANVAKLGWSPVLRGLLGLKRRSDPRRDEVDDGARAKIVEEAVIKIIHAEGVRLSVLEESNLAHGPKLFADPSQVSLRFLQSIKALIGGHEVAANKYWEWEEAILSGYEIFDKLRTEGQGTVIVDMERRSIGFEPEVYLTFGGKVAGLGTAWLAEGDSATERNAAAIDGVLTDFANATRIAILNALDLDETDAERLSEVNVAFSPEGLVSVKAVGGARARMWERSALGFRISQSAGPAGTLVSALAISDD